MKRTRGFTLVEVLITAAIIATLASIALPVSEIAMRRSQETDLRRALREIRDALDAYKRASDDGRILRSPEESGYPPTLRALVNGVVDVKSPIQTKIYFLRRIPRDPLNIDFSVAPELTWGLRSYDSPPADPHPGNDVFDVYSRSNGVGLNGIAYKDW